MKQPSELSTRRSTPTLASTPSPAGKCIGSNIFHQLSVTESGWVCPCALKPRDKDPPLLLSSNLRSETKIPNQESAGFYWKRVAHILPACQVMAICAKLNFFLFWKNRTDFKITTISEATHKHVFIVSSLRIAKITTPLHTHVCRQKPFPSPLRFLQ